MSNSKVGSDMSGLTAIAGTAFLAWLKVDGHFDISWFWVFTPIWLPLAILAAALLIVAVGALVERR